MRIIFLTAKDCADSYGIMKEINIYYVAGLILFLFSISGAPAEPSVERGTAGAGGAKSLGGIYSPVIVGVPPADAVSGLCEMPDGKIRHYNYGGQAENLIRGPHKKVSNRMYVESSDRGLTWTETQAPAGKEFGVSFDKSRGRYFNIINIGETAWFLDCGTDGECVGKTQICPWWLEINAEPLVLDGRILMPITLRTSSSQNLDFVFGTVFLISDDFGKSWKKSNRLNVPHHKAGASTKGRAGTTTQWSQPS